MEVSLRGYWVLAVSTAATDFKIIRIRRELAPKQPRAKAGRATADVKDTSSQADVTDILCERYGSLSNKIQSLLC